MHRYVFPNALQNYLFSLTYLLTRWQVFIGLYLFWHESLFFALSLRIFLFIIRSCSTASRLEYPDSLYPPLVPCSRFSPRVEKSPKNAIFLAQSKIIHYLCARIYAGGDMSLAKSVSHGTFYRVGSDILIAFIDALYLMYET